MPPKKKKDGTKKDDQPQNPLKLVVQPLKKDTKQGKEPPNQQKPPSPKSDVKNPEQSKPAELIKPDSDSQKKEAQQLSQAQLLQRRKLKFNIMGADVDPEQAQRVKKERLQKFGGEPAQSKQQLEKRKEKFGTKPSLLQDDGKQILQKWLQKFGGTSKFKQDPSILEQRRKKFGLNDISLDDAIKRDREQGRGNKDHHRNSKHYRDHKDYRRSRPHNERTRDKYDHNHKKFKR